AARAHLELAMSLASVDGRLGEAADAYQTALRLADDELLGELWGDAAMLTRSREDVDWNHTKTEDERRRMIATMWDIRGALSDMSGMERAAEHYRRLNHAWLRYRRWGTAGAAPS